ncbi:ACT domain-containing protein [Amniculibacterium sp. G2-70]|nr:MULTISPECIES: ACT domain-containing protein [Amniculibacterium]
MNNNTITIYKNKALINFEGQDFLGQYGIDSRIFHALNNQKISVGIISQQAIENGISVLVDEKDAKEAVSCLEREFEKERKFGVVNSIFNIEGLSALGFVTDNFNKILTALKKNKIYPLLLNQVAIDGRVNLVVVNSQLEKTKAIIESEIFGKAKSVHLALIGHGNVGGALLDQILESSTEILSRKNINLKVVAIANSKNLIVNQFGLGNDWLKKIKSSTTASKVDYILDFVKENQLENLIVVDNTASKDFVKHYPTFAENGFDVVSSNKIFNTQSISSYRNFRKILKKNNKKYLYETNVGAGLPLIDTIKLLHLSGENITRIKGVFSGSLSYIFNHFSVRNEKFSTILQEALDKGYTEPDPREDLSGNDVARKLLILARELDLINEFDDINIQNLIPENLQNIDKQEFLNRFADLDDYFQNIKNNLPENHVLRFVGDLHGDLQQEKGSLDVNLITVPAQSALGQLKGSDSIFEIYTESYGENPIVIMGAGAGAQVTARGVFGDILRISETR